MAIEHTLRQYAFAYLDCKKYTEEIDEASHNECSDTQGNTSLARYFAWSKEKRRYDVDYWGYCEMTGEAVCEKCAIIYVAILNRKIAKKKLTGCKVSITKYALSLVKGEV